MNLAWKKFQCFQLPRNCALFTFLFKANTIRKPYWQKWYHVISSRHIGWLRRNLCTLSSVKSWVFLYIRQWPSGVTLVQGAYCLIVPKVYVVGETLLTQSFSCLNCRGITYHSVYMWKSCSLSGLYGPILTDVVPRLFSVAYLLITTKLINLSRSKIPTSFGFLKSLHIRMIRCWDILSKHRLDGIYSLVLRHFRGAYWLITTKTLVVDKTFLTKSYHFLNGREIMYHSPYMGEILFSVNAWRTPCWLACCHVNSGQDIAWL